MFIQNVGASMYSCIMSLARSIAGFHKSTRDIYRTSALLSVLCSGLELWGRPCIVTLTLLHAGMTISFYSADTDKSFYVHGRLWFRCTYRTLENYLASPMLALHTCALGLDDTLAHLAKAFCHVGCHSLGLGPAINRLDAGKVLWEGTE